MRLKEIFSSLATGDVIVTSHTKFVVIREIKDNHSCKRYVLALMCGCERHCTTVVPDAFVWNDSVTSFVTLLGDELAGWNNDVQVDRQSYIGKDLEALKVILVNDELPSLSDSEDFVGPELSEKAILLRGAAHVAPNNRIMWHSVLRELGIQASEKQLKMLNALFDLASIGSRHTIIELLSSMLIDETSVVSERKNSKLS